MQNKYINYFHYYNSILLNKINNIPNIRISKNSKYYYDNLGKFTKNMFYHNMPDQIYNKIAISFVFSYSNIVIPESLNRIYLREYLLNYMNPYFKLGDIIISSVNKKEMSISFIGITRLYSNKDILLEKLNTII